MHTAVVKLPIGLTKLQTMVEHMSDVNAQYNAELLALQQDVTNQTTEVASVRTLLNGFGQQLQAALAQARNAGATPQMLAAVVAVHQSVLSNTQGLVDAVAANTPSADQTGTTGADTTGGGAAGSTTATVTGETTGTATVA